MICTGSSRWILHIGGDVESPGDSFYVLPSITITNLLLSATITFALSIIVNLMFSRKIKKLDMVESLKGVE